MNAWLMQSSAKIVFGRIWLAAKKSPYLADRGREIAERDRVGGKSLPAAECEMRRGGTLGLPRPSCGD